METKTVIVNRGGLVCKGMADFFTKEDEVALNNLYFSWKNFNEEVVKFNSRRMNLPEIISEGLTCILFDLVRTNATNFTNMSKCDFDCLDVRNGNTIQVKAASSITGKKVGPTSFGPQSEYDILYFSHFDCDNDKVDFYLIDEDLSEIIVKKSTKETFSMQQAQGRRPRFNLLDFVIKMKKEPIKTYYWRLDNDKSI